MATTLSCYILLGLISGFFGSILFMRNDANYLKYITLVASAFIGLLTPETISNVININIPENVNAIYYLYFFGSWMLGVIGVILVSYLSGRKKYGLTIYDIIVGHHLDIENLNKKEERLKTDRADLEKQQEKLSQDKVELNKLQDEIASQASVFLDVISENGPTLITQDHIDSCPEYNRMICKAISMIRLESQNPTNRLNELLESYAPNKIDEAINLVKAQLRLTASYINSYIAGAGESRVHFRIKGKDDLFHAIVAIYGSGGTANEWMAPITPMPFKDSLIERSWEKKRPIVSSLNPGYSLDSTNTYGWEDFLTVAYRRPTVNNLPIISMGITFKNQKGSRALLAHLCNVRFDLMLGEALEPFFSIINNLDDLSKGHFLKKASII